MPLSYAVLSPSGDVQMVGAMHDSPEAAALIQEIGAVVLTDAQADQIGRSPGQWRMAPDGTLGPRPPPEVPLAEAQAKATAAVDATAEAVRLRFITPGSGQALVYQAKRDEADRFLARFDTEEASQERSSASSGSAGSADYPMINAEVGITAPTAWQVALTIRSLSDQWTMAAAAIETARLAAKAAIGAATNANAVQAVLNGVTWPPVPT